jgi:hypothetical protein
MFRLTGFRHLSKAFNKTVECHWQNHLLRISGVLTPTQRKYSNEPTGTNSTRGRIPTQAQIVICGGGVVGCSVAYHLALEGWKDIILVEQGR